MNISAFFVHFQPALVVKENLHYIQPNSFENEFSVKIGRTTPEDIIN